MGVVGSIAVPMTGDFSSSRHRSLVSWGRYGVGCWHFAPPIVRVTFGLLSARARPKVGRVVAEDFSGLGWIVG